MPRQNREGLEDEFEERLRMLELLVLASNKQVMRALSIPHDHALLLRNPVTIARETREKHSIAVALSGVNQAISDGLDVLDDLSADIREELDAQLTEAGFSVIKDLSEKAVSSTNRTGNDAQ